MNELIVQLSDELLQRLKNKSHYQQVSVEDLARVAIETYLEDDDPTEEEILNTLRSAMKNALAGNVRPALETLDEIEQELLQDAD